MQNVSRSGFSVRASCSESKAFAFWRFPARSRTNLPRNLLGSWTELLLCNNPSNLFDIYMGGSRGGDRGSGHPPPTPPPGILAKMCLSDSWNGIGLILHSIYVKYSHKLKKKKKKVLNVETSSWLELETLTFLVKGLHPLKSGNQSII